jgi:unsaturated chondroitin disaccharide hydrolase
MNVFSLNLAIIFIVVIFQINCYGQKLDSLVNNAIRISLIHLKKSVKDISDTTLYPSYGTKELQWKLTNKEDWTSGFYPGCLWYAYELSNDPDFKQWAKQWTNSLEQEKYNNKTHDLGFKFICSFGNGIRLEKDERDNNYKNVLLTAAHTLSERYDSVIKCLSSNWDNKKIRNSFPVIIDIMMNLELLFWASENGAPKFYAKYAVDHATKTGKDFIRSDGSTYHIVRYDKNTGKVINKGTIQGEGNETTWARGHAWATYGMIVVYSYTKDEQFLNLAMKLANYFIEQLPEDHISFWDFNSDIKYRDVSATCVVASGLFELIDCLDDDSLKKYYLIEAEAMLKSLCKEPYFLENIKTNCLLDHSVHYLPIHSNVDVPSIFADYYFLEAILRYKALINENN